MKPNWQDIKSEFLSTEKCPCTRCQMLMQFEAELQKKIDTIYQENCIDPQCAGLLNCQHCIECGAAHRVNDLKEILGLKITDEIKRIIPKSQQRLI